MFMLPSEISALGLVWHTPKDPHRNKWQTITLDDIRLWSGHPREDPANGEMIGFKNGVPVVLLLGAGRGAHPYYLPAGVEQKLLTQAKEWMLQTPEDYEYVRDELKFARGFLLQQCLTHIDPVFYGAIATKIEPGDEDGKQSRPVKLSTINLVEAKVTEPFQGELAYSGSRGNVWRAAERNWWPVTLDVCHAVQELVEDYRYTEDWSQKKRLHAEDYRFVPLAARIWLALRIDDLSVCEGIVETSEPNHKNGIWTFNKPNEKQLAELGKINVRELGTNYMDYRGKLAAAASID